jgi:Holliday junction resolvase-like predicted endonuclease
VSLTPVCVLWTQLQARLLRQRCVTRDTSPCHPKTIGSRAELAVAAYLVELGFHIVALNLRVGRDEIDVVARKCDLVVVVEVRFRGAGAWTTGFGSIQEPKRRHVRRAARRLWQKRYAHDLSVSRLRIDAAAVTFDPQGCLRVNYCPAAF